MMRALSARDRRALTLGASVVGAAVVIALGVLPSLRTYEAARNTLASERGLLTRERDVVRAAPAAAAKLRAAEATLATFARMAFDAAEPELATLEVARLIESIASMGNLDDVRSAPLGIIATEDEVTRLRVRVTGLADFAQLMLLLQRIEAGPALLHIDELAVRTDERAHNAAESDAPLSFAITLNGTGIADRARLIRLAADPQPVRERDDLPSETALLAALIDDPFRPGVNLPGRAPAEEPQAEQPAPAAETRLAIMGTVVLPHDRGLVMVALGTEPPRLMRIGDRIGGLLLVRIEPGAAEFEDESGSKTIVRVPKPGA